LGDLIVLKATANGTMTTFIDARNLVGEPTRLLSISYAVFCLKKKKQQATSSLQKKNHTDNKPNSTKTNHIRR